MISFKNVLTTLGLGIVIGLISSSSSASETSLVSRVERQTGSVPVPCVREQMAMGNQHLCGVGCCSRSQQCGDGRCH